LTRSSFLKTRKHFRKHYIEKDSPRIARRKNRQAFPVKVKGSDLVSSDNGDISLSGVAHISVIIGEIFPLILTHDTLRRRYKGEVD